MGTLTACGRPVGNIKTVSSNYTFQSDRFDDSTGLLLESESSVQLRAQDPDLQTIDRPADAPSEEQLKSALSKEISSFKMLNEITDPLLFQAEVELKTNDDQKTQKPNELLIFVLNRQNEKTQNLVAEDASLNYLLRLRCVDEMCARGWALLFDKKANQYAEIRFERKIEYIKSLNESEPLTEIENIESDLLRDAIEYSLPVVRHSTEVTNGAKASRIVIEAPEVDEVSEDFSADEEAPTAEATPSFDPPVKMDPLPLQTLSPVKKTPPPIELKAQEPPPVQPIAPKQNPPQGPLKELKPNFELTEDLNDIYKLKLPPQLLRNSKTVIKDPLAIQANFTIVPVSEQQEFEPAYRMAAIANAFVQQKIKVYRNACNIFVRSVMSLSGYSQGSVYNANSFHITFTEKKNNLDKWKMSRFALGNSTQTNISKSGLKTYFETLAPSHAVVAQVRRSGRHGHVGLLVREGKDVVVYDASLNQHGPRRTVVNPNQFLNSSRPNAHLYSLPGLVDKRLDPVHL